MNKHLKDPKQITSLIITARDSLHDVEYKIQQKQMNMRFGIKPDQ